MDTNLKVAVDMKTHDIENQQDDHTINTLDDESVNSRSHDEEVCIYKTLSYRILTKEYLFSFLSIHIHRKNRRRKKRRRYIKRKAVRWCKKMTTQTEQQL